MITVTYNDESFECTTALKGTDYIHLLDANDAMIVSFDGITEFTGFSISGGSWTTPTSPDGCYLVTIGEDGVLRKGGHRCSEIADKADKSSVVTATLLSASWVGSSAPYSYSLSVQGVTATSNQEILPASDITLTQLQALQFANIQDGGQSAGVITLYAWGIKPTIDIPIRVLKRGD